MRIKTERLIIRPFELKDIDDIYKIYQSENTCRYLLHEPWTDKNKFVEFKHKLENNTLSKETVLNLAVVKDKKIIGDISAWYTDMKDTVEIGYSFLESESGKGYATEALKALIDKIFKIYKIHRIIATLDSRNSASAKLCERLGMRNEAYFVKDYWNKGEWTDTKIYAILKSEWK